MRSSNSKSQGKVEGVNSEPPLENGLPSKEDEDDSVRELAAKVVDDVVKRASETARQRSAGESPNPATVRNRAFDLQRLPTIQIDTVPSAPSSPVDLTPPDESFEEPSSNGQPLDESDIELELDTTEQAPEASSEDLREFLKSYVEDILSQAMVVAEKKLQFAGLPEEDEEEELGEVEKEEVPMVDRAGPSSASEPPPPAQSPTPDADDPEIRATAEKLVQEVIEKASETAAEKLENGIAGLNFPITFDEAPDDVKEAAQSFVKEIVGKAVAMAEEKSVPTVPFNFEDVDLMKTSGPWYIRAREALIRLLRTACFCTPRRTDS